MIIFSMILSACPGLIASITRRFSASQSPGWVCDFENLGSESKILEFFNWIIKGSVLWMFYWFDPSPASWQPHIACALTINNMHSKLKDTRRILSNAESTNRIWNIATTSYPCVRTTGPRVFMHFTENRSADVNTGQRRGEYQIIFIWQIWPVNVVHIRNDLSNKSTNSYM